jgi:hypothetical protein
MKDFSPISEAAANYLASRIEEEYLSEYRDNRGAVEIESIEVGNFPTHEHYYVSFSCEGYRPDLPKGKQYPIHVGTWIGDFRHFSDCIEDMNGEIVWTHRFPGSGTTVYTNPDIQEEKLKKKQFDKARKRAIVSM